MIFIPPKENNGMDAPYWWITDKQKDDIRICHACMKCDNWKHLKADKTTRWTGIIIPARTIKLNGFTLNLNSQCNIQRSLLIRDVIREQKIKHNPVKTAPLPNFIEQIKTGSEKVQHGMRGGKKYYQYEDTYETKYNDCLVPKEWLEAHKDFEMPEQTIEVTIIGTERTISLDGDYKTAKLKEFMKSAKQIKMEV